MAHAPVGGRIVLTGTATQLHTLLGIANTTFGTMTWRMESTAAGRMYFGLSNAVTAAGLNALGYLDAAEFRSVDILGNMYLGTYWLISSAPGDIMYVDGVIY